MITPGKPYFSLRRPLPHERPHRPIIGRLYRGYNGVIWTTRRFSLCLLIPRAMCNTTIDS